MDKHSTVFTDNLYLPGKTANSIHFCSLLEAYFSILGNEHYELTFSAISYLAGTLTFQSKSC
jgi:hypothetical protein